MDDDDVLTQGTQPSVDPRRVGRNNSGLSAEDVADVICILHPSTPAAFRLVSDTAKRAPQHILQNSHIRRRDPPPDPDNIDDEETFIIEETSSNRAMDLALRFSTHTFAPHLGFVFGRNTRCCDIAVISDAHKRVSNVHCAVYFNETGVLMCRDMSTNGTMVDDVLLKGKTTNHPHSRMLLQGSVMQILSPSHEEIIKFVVRFPSRDGFYEEYDARFQAYMVRQNTAISDWRVREGFDEPGAQRVQTAIKAPVPQNQFGMHWNGGEIYNVVGQVGKGAFASVYQLATKLDGQLYAAKELEKRKFMKNGILDRKLENEMQIMQSIDHPSIVAYRDFQDSTNHLYIIMEFVPCGDLQQWLGERGPLSENIVKQVATQVLDALDYLHKKNITHRDIKPDNILLSSVDSNNFVIKLSDFGLSKVVKNNDTFLKTFCGTLLYCAPEVFPHYDNHIANRGTKRTRKSGQHAKPFRSYSHAVDIWSLGAVLWYSLCHKPPFEGVADNTGRGMFDKIMMTPLDAADLAKQGVSDDAVTLLVAMLNTDPASRPSAEECLQHPWLGQHTALSSRRQPRKLGAIAEEEQTDTVEGSEEPDVSVLSLDERGADDDLGSQRSEVSLNSSDMEFFDPRKSKRFKAYGTKDKDQDQDQDDLIDSSPEMELIPIMHDSQPQGQAHAQARNDRPRPPKLFGEISLSELHGPAFGLRVAGPQSHSSSVRSREGDTTSENNEQHKTSSNAAGGSSLLGAESMVREMDIDSPSYSHGSNDADGEATGQNTPKTPASAGEITVSQNTSTADPDETPRAAQPAQLEPFSRRIQIPIPASFYYDPLDPSTHNIEYASKISGHDFAREPTHTPKGSNSLLSNSKRSSESDPDSAQSKALSGAESGIQPDGQEESRVGEERDGVSSGDEEVPSYVEDDPSNPRPRFGRLVSTPDSFTAITISLDERITSWGRSSRCTYSYPDKNDTRVSKQCLTVYFHAPGIETMNEGEEDFDKLPGLYCGVLTHGSNGVKINGIPLSKGEPGKKEFGRIHTGDIIEVWWPDNERAGLNAGLKFYVQLFHGLGAARRSLDGPRFTVEVEKHSRSQRLKGYREGKENAPSSGEVAKV